jgi:hypothetical protein
MKSLNWTKSELNQAFEGCATLREVITALENKMSAVGEVICEIKVNDTALSEADEEKFADCAIADLQSLAIVTNRPTDLVNDALRSAAGLVPQLEQSALTTAELLRAGEVARAIDGFKETVDGCQWLVETLLHVRGASEGIGQPIQNSVKWAESEMLIGRVVDEVSTAHSRMDSILVADLLEYEMTAALQSWKSTIDGELAGRELDTRPDANP